ncbi:MAG: DUF3261 domain-containing protein [Pseudomonadales bacterium]
MATLPLPDSSELPCCWQSQESLEVDYRDELYQLTSVMAVEKRGLTLIVFDPLGRKLLSVTQHGSEIEKQLFTDSAELPVQWLLPAVYLAHMNQQRWSTDQSPWSVGEQDSRLVLYFRQRPTVMVQGFTDGDLPQAGHQRVVRFIEHGLTLTITTLVSEAL